MIKLSGTVSVQAFRFPNNSMSYIDERNSLEKNNDAKGLELFNNQFMKAKSVHHNSITVSCGAYIADLMANTPSRQKLDSTHGYILLGTGWTGSSPSTHLWLEELAAASTLSSGFPLAAAEWGSSQAPASNANKVLFRAYFPEGSFESVTLNEIGISSTATQSTATNFIAYAQIYPYVVVTADDFVQADWSITIGSGTL